MIATKFIAAGALALSGAMHLPVVPPLLIRDGDDLLLPPPADTPVYVYLVTWPEGAVSNPWAGGERAADALRREVQPEPFMVESIDEARRTLLIRTSADGRDSLRRFGATVAGPEVDALRKSCTELLVEFAIGASGPPLRKPGVYPNRQCPAGARIDPDRTLIVEGLDTRRHRLFVAASDDPRWAIHESVRDDGTIKLLGKGRDKSRTSYVSFATPPTGERLRTLKVWQFDRMGRGIVIATIDLTRGDMTGGDMTGSKGR